jgi:hypothetical protein
MFGYDYEMIYKKDKENVMVDSYLDNSRKMGHSLSLKSLGCNEESQKEWISNKTWNLIQQL